jgi:FkbM family methyltransferase
MNPWSSVVIFGAGNMGKRVARAVNPSLFCDSNSSLWGTSIAGIPVVSPSEAVGRSPDATFVIAIWNPSRREGMMHHGLHLRALGAKHVVPFTALFREYGEFFLPNFFWERPEYYAEHQAAISRARDLFDSDGVAEFDRQLRLRLGDPSDQIIDLGVQYFPTNLFQLSDREVFIDCGAYDGDTIAQFRRASGDQFSQIVAFEPDPVNYAALQTSAGGDSRIRLQPYATSARRETLRFSVAGTGSHISSSGTCEILATTLDEALHGIVPTYMKFDIEGSEPDALEGARETITRHRPKMAVCLYHAPDHLWSIPLRLHEFLPNSHLTLRTYNSDGFECVCYCVPR